MNKLAKKSIVILVIITVLSGFVSYANQVNQTPEVTAANKLAKLGIIVDMSTNPVAYELNKSITRREMLKVMMNLSKIEVGDNCIGKFTDLTASDWGCKYAETALDNGFIAPNNLFRPDDNVSKIEALKMILQSRGFSNTDTNQDWRAEYVKTAVSQGILSTGFTDYDTPGIRGWIFIVSSNAIDMSYQSIIDYVDQNITKIMMPNSLIKPVNDKWFADGYGFISDKYVYVDFEDGHNLYRALLECKKEENIISCNYLAIFEKQDDWTVIQRIDTQKDKPIIYQYAKDYEWKR